MIPVKNISNFPFAAIISIAFIFSIALAGAQPIQIDPYHYSITKTKQCKKEAVVCAHPLAAKAGILVMQKGGNAVDAAIATQWALAVVYPGAGNIGGGGFLVASLANQKQVAIDYRETAPQHATKDMYIDTLTGKANTSLSQYGHLSAGIPGTPAGLFAAHKYAKLPMKVLIQPAIDLARKGFVISAGEAQSLNEAKPGFIKYNNHPVAFVKNNGEWKEGDTLVQPELANTLERIKNLGLAGFYEGTTAQLIAAEMKHGKGIITLKDLQQYKAVERTPEIFNYKGYKIITMPLPGGGLLLRQMLTMLASRPLGSYGYGSVKSIQLMVEVERRAYADRAKYLGDPAFTHVPMKTLSSEKYLQERMKDFDSTRAGKSELIKAGVLHESDETTHISIIDKNGNAVSVTTTLNGSYGSKTVVAGAGFLLNNEMDDFSIQEGVANMYGAVGGKANSIEPGKRMLSSMTPSIVMKNNYPYIVVGTPGGTTITTSVLQSILNVIDFKMNAADAVYKPKFHHQWLPDIVDMENGFDPEVVSKLQAMGYNLHERNSIGRTEMILVKQKGMIEAVADNRGNDAVEGN